MSRFSTPTSYPHPIFCAARFRHWSPIPVLRSCRRLGPCQSLPKNLADAHAGRSSRCGTSPSSRGRAWRAGHSDLVQRHCGGMAARRHRQWRRLDRRYADRRSRFVGMRCALKGWRGGLMPDLEVPGELPDTAAGWRAQQARWNKGHRAMCAQTASADLGDDFPLWKKAIVTLQIWLPAFFALVSTARSPRDADGDGRVYIQSVAMPGLSVSASD